MRYGLAALFAAAALGIVLLLVDVRHGTGAGIGDILLVAAILASAWLGGIGPSLAAGVLSAIADAYLLAPQHIAPDTGGTLIRFAAFLAFAVLAGSFAMRRQKVEEALRQARNQIEAGARERIAAVGKANLALQLSEERWRRIFEFSPVGIDISGTDRRFISANPALQKMLGYTEDELRALTAIDLTHEEDRAATEALLAELENGSHKGYQTERRYRRKDGRVIWASVNTSYVPPGEGTPAFFLSIIVDITERKLAEDNLRQQKAQFDALFHHAPEAIALIDRQYAVIRINEEFTRVFGYAPEEALGRHIGHLIVPESLRQQGRMILDWIIRDGLRVEIETTRRRKDGSLLDVSLIATPITEWGAYLIYRDITDRKRGEAELRRSEAYLTEGQRLSRTGSWAWNVATQENSFWSQEHFRIYGFEPGRMPIPYREAVQRIHPEDRQLFEETVGRAVRDKIDFDLHHRVILPDGSVRYLHGVGHPVTDSNGELVEFVGTVMDITEQRRAEAALQEAQAELARAARLTTMGEFAASIAHEINQPLAAVVTNANACLRWLGNDPPNLDEARETAKRIVRDGNRASEVIGSVRALMRNTTSGMVPLDINEVILGVLALTRSELHRHQIAVRTALDRELPLFSGDRGQLQQVVLNLIVNAIDAMALVESEERVLRIATARDAAGTMQIEVQDSGPGLDPRLADRIFDVFFTTKPNGMGMGLTICRSIVEAHNGQLRASPAEGGGAAFTVTLPIAVGG